MTKLVRHVTQNSICHLKPVNTTVLGGVHTAEFSAEKSAQNRC